MRPLDTIRDSKLPGVRKIKHSIKLDVGEFEAGDTRKTSHRNSKNHEALNLDPYNINKENDSEPLEKSAPVTKTKKFDTATSIVNNEISVIIDESQELDCWDMERKDKASVFLDKYESERNMSKITQNYKDVEVQNVRKSYIFPIIERESLKQKRQLINFDKKILKKVLFSQLFFDAYIQPNIF